MARTKISGGMIQTGAVTIEKFAGSVSLGNPRITTVEVTDSNYDVVGGDVPTAGGYIKITGKGFQIGAIVKIDGGTSATSTSVVNTSTIRAQLPAKSAATYKLYVINPDGGVGIKPIGVTYAD